MFGHDAGQNAHGGAAPSETLLEGLTDPQREAVQHGDGPLLVLAAAGSGKTRVITRRIARLIAEGCPPWSILALTFTNKAAGEMRERVDRLIDPGGDGDGGGRGGVRGLTVTTFHSLCARLLRRYAEEAQMPGLRPDFTIYPTADQMALMKRTIAALDLSTSNWPPRSCLSTISNAKNELLDADAYAAAAGDFYTKTMARIFTAYDRAMRRAGAIDFDDLLLYAARMLESCDRIRAECNRRWRHLLIDEYQDTNRAQLSLARLLAGERAPSPDADLAGLPGIDDDDDEADAGGAAALGPNICVVGDPDQAIYGWRGADLTNILDFERHYPGCRVITLGENFRSTAPILSVADTLIKKNNARRDKPLFTSSKGEAELPAAVLCRDERHEAELVCDWFRSLREEQRSGDGPALEWRDMAVFYRTNSLSRVLEDAFRRASIPYVIARGTAFYDREEVKNAIAYLRAVANTADDVSLERIVNTPARGIGKTSLDRVREIARGRGVPLFEQLGRAGEVEGLTARSANAMRSFVEMIDIWTGSGSFMGERVSGSLPELVDRVVEESGLRAHYAKQARSSKSEADAERVDNLDELVTSAREFEEEYDPAADPLAFDADSPESPGVPPLLGLLRAFLERVALVSDADAVHPEQGSVTLMTLHAAKGLEFGAAAIVGMEEGLLPHARSFDSESQLEEERRLAFVGITRAMRRLLLTAARYRAIRGVPERTIPSRFFDEMAGEHLRVSDQSSEPDEGPSIQAGTPTESPAGFDVGGGGSLEDRLEQIRDQQRARAKAAPKEASKDYPVGAEVKHPQFGRGKVVGVSGPAHGGRIEIDFAGLGRKTLVLGYARLTRVQ